MSSIKTNIILNGLNTITGIVFPVVTFPYAARVLLPEGIGTINFLNSIILYIISLSTLGIPMYAVKEVAKFRDNKVARDRFTIEIFHCAYVLMLPYFYWRHLFRRFIRISYCFIFSVSPFCLLQSGRNGFTKESRTSNL